MVHFRVARTSQSHNLRSLRLSLPAVWIAGGTGLALLTSQLLPWASARAWGLALASGLSVAVMLRQRYRLTELFAVAVALAVVVLSLASAAALALGIFPWGGVFGVAVLTLAPIVFLRGKILRLTLTRADLGAVAATTAALPFVLAVYVASGPVHRPEGDGFRMRSWVARDSAYLFSITQQMVERRTLAEEHPFAAGVPLCYARLGHCGLALLTAARGQPATQALWDLFPLWHVAAIMMLYHAVDRRMKGRSRQLYWTTLVIVALGVGVRPDFYTYPQTQGLALPVLFLAFWWFALPRWWAVPPLRTIGWLLALWLAAAHTVSGTVAAIAFASGAVSDLLSRNVRASLRRVVTWALALLALAAVVIVVGMPPYGPELCWPRPGAWKLLRNELTPYLVIYAVALGGLTAALRRKASSEALLIAGLLFAALGYSLQGLFCAEAFSAFFAVFNAQRFIYFALPVALPFLLQAHRRVGEACLVALWAWLLLSPPRIVRDWPELVTGRALLFTRDDLALYEMIRQRTPPKARFVTNCEHWGLPTFTGRSEFARGPVMLFGLHSVSESEAQRLFALREQFLSSARPMETWPELRRYGIEYVFIEDVLTPQAKTLWARLKNEASADGYFTDDMLTSNAVVMRWVSRHDRSF